MTLDETFLIKFRKTNKHHLQYINAAISLLQQAEISEEELKTTGYYDVSALLEALTEKYKSLRFIFYNNLSMKVLFLKN